MPRQWLADIKALRNCYGNERELQQSIERILARHRVPFLPEHRFTPRDRIDFLVLEGLKPKTIGIEVKTNSGGMAVWRQLTRYADHVDEMILVTTAPLNQILTLLASGGRVVPLTTVELWKNP